MEDIHTIEWVSFWIISSWRIFHSLSLNFGTEYIACFLQRKSMTIWWLQFSMLFTLHYHPLSLLSLTRYDYGFESHSRHFFLIFRMWMNGRPCDILDFINWDKKVNFSIWEHLDGFLSEDLWFHCFSFSWLILPWMKWNRNGSYDSFIWLTYRVDGIPRYGTSWWARMKDNGLPIDYNVFQVTLQTQVVLVMTLQMCFVTRNWTLINFSGE